MKKAPVHFYYFLLQYFLLSHIIIYHQVSDFLHNYNIVFINIHICGLYF